MARATAVTLMVWVSRLCTTPLVAPAATTWVTSASREKAWAKRIRSRSERNSDSPGACGLGLGVGRAPAGDPCRQPSRVTYRLRPAPGRARR